MSVAPTDLKDYGSANMQETDSGSPQGGAIDLTTKIDFTDISAPDGITVVSSDPGDTMGFYYWGRDVSGVIITGSTTLMGITPIPLIVTLERILKVQLLSPAAGTITITKTTGGAILITMEPGIITVRRPFYNAAAPSVGSKTYYEKFFIKNTHGSLALTLATVAQLTNRIGVDPNGRIAFGLESSLDGSDSVTNRLTAPSETINVTTKNVANSQNLSPGAAQGIWMSLALSSADVATKTSVTFELAGQST
jgi:hypothetical protein